MIKMKSLFVKSQVIVVYPEVKIDLGSLKAEFSVWFSTEVLFFISSFKSGISRGFCEISLLVYRGHNFFKN